MNTEPLYLKVNVKVYNCIEIKLLHKTICQYCTFRWTPEVVVPFRFPNQMSDHLSAVPLATITLFLQRLQLHTKKEGRNLPIFAYGQHRQTCIARW